MSRKTQNEQVSRTLAYSVQGCLVCFTLFYFPLFQRPQHPNASHWGPFRDTPHLRHHQRAHQPETGPNHRSWKYLQKKMWSISQFRTSKNFLDIVMFSKDRQAWGPWMLKCSGNFFENFEMTRPKSHFIIGYIFKRPVHTFQQKPWGLVSVPNCQCDFKFWYHRSNRGNLRKAVSWNKIARAGWLTTI